MDQIDRRVQDTARDNEQNEPYQIVDLFSEFGRGLLHRLRTPKDSFQKYDDRDCRNEDGDELEHVFSLHPMKNASQASHAILYTTERNDPSQGPRRPGAEARPQKFRQFSNLRP